MPTADLALPALIVIGLFVLAGIFIQSLFLHWAARIAGIEHRSLGRAFWTTILGGIASAIFSLALGVIAPGIGNIGGTIAGFFVAALIMMPMFRTTYIKALGATVLAWVLGIVVIGGIALALALAGGLAFLAAS